MEKLLSRGKEHVDACLRVFRGTGISKPGISDQFADVHVNPHVHAGHLHHPKKLSFLIHKAVGHGSVTAAIFEALKDFREFLIKGVRAACGAGRVSRGKRHSDKSPVQKVSKERFRETQQWARVEVLAEALHRELLTLEPRYKNVSRERLLGYIFKYAEKNYQKAGVQS